MKKTKVMSTIAMVLFILALVWQVVNDALYYIGAFRFGTEGSLLVRELFFEVLPAIAGIILLIIGAKKARTGVNPPQYKLGCFFLAGGLLLSLVISIIVAKGDIMGSKLYTARIILLIIAFMLIAFDSILGKPNKAMGIIGAVLLIVLAMGFMSYYMINLTKGMPTKHMNNSKAFEFALNILTIASYYTALQFIGIGALLYAIGRQPKDSVQLPPAQNGGNNYDYVPPVQNGNQAQKYDYVPPVQNKE